MDGKIVIDPNMLSVFHELKTRKIYVGELKYNDKKNIYSFTYSDKYRELKNAIPLGPDLDLFKQTHQIKGKLFASFADRIPDTDNPAYADYCAAEGISINENNPIILLGTIGSRGPSSFVFEKVIHASISINSIIEIRKKLKISQYDLSEAFGLSKVTLQKIEAGESSDDKTIRLLQIYFTFPQVAIWQLYQTGSAVHKDVLVKLVNYFNSQDSRL